MEFRGGPAGVCFRPRPRFAAKRFIVPEFLITLTTDFGLESPYVAAMKGALLSVNHSVRLIDLSHQIPAQDIRYAAFFLASSVPYYPAGTLHVVVVDPGVGTDRA